MANTTKNYGLIKPLENEYYDVNIQNSNMDAIDSKLKDIQDTLDTKLKDTQGTLDTKLKDVQGTLDAKLKALQSTTQNINTRLADKQYTLLLQSRKWQQESDAYSYVVDLEAVEDNENYLLCKTVTDNGKAYNKNFAYIQTGNISKGCVTFVAYKKPTMNLSVLIRRI